mgnify:CR=1 FL=1
MIVFNLMCEQQHRFEGWFDSGDDFSTQREAGQIECPMCASKLVRKVPAGSYVKAAAADKASVENQAQFDALVSFAFSVGAEAFERCQVLRRVNAGQWVAAACAMDAWRKSDIGGELEIIDALVRRRAAEKALFLKGSPHNAAPSAFMRAKLDHAASILGAPIHYAPAPVAGAAPAAKKRPEPARILTEILKSEPVTEALLLTKIAGDDQPLEEITTAHAKPVARTLEQGHRALWRDEQAKRAEQNQLGRRFPVETIGLVVLLLFGLVLVSLGGSALFGKQGDMVDFMGAAVLAAPGFVAALMASFGLLRGQSPRAARA